MNQAIQIGNEHPTSNIEHPTSIARQFDVSLGVGSWMLDVGCFCMNPILRFLYLLYRLFSWSRFWAARRLTRPGLVVAGAVLLTGVMGFDTENSVAYQAFMPLLALLLVAFLFSWFFKMRFAVERSL